MKLKRIPKLKKLRIKRPNKSKIFLKVDDKTALQNLIKCQTALLKWYETNKRSLPWREGPVDPYRVWISEIMLQQSTMVTVIPYFERWIKRFPTVIKLSQAADDELLKYWQGLGYYQRVRNLKKAALQIQKFIEVNNRWPQTFDEWKCFTGVGDYTAAAVSAIAFKQKVLPVDGNVIRVLSRFWMISDPLNNSYHLLKLKNKFYEYALKQGKPIHDDLAQAFMELGALVCRPKNEAKCEICPLSNACRAFKQSKQNTLPRAKIKSPTVKIMSLSLIYKGPENSPILRKIPKGYRLAGQWELPSLEIECEEPQSLIAEYKRVFECFGPQKHSITKHRYWAWGLNLGNWGDSEPLPQGHCQLSELGPNESVTTLTRKILFEVEKSSV